WSGAEGALDRLVGRTRLGVVTNCSVRLGRAAAARLQVPWGVVITAEEAGFYKPDPRPYRLALERLGVAAGEAAFVAGSGYDLIGTAAVGVCTHLHHRGGFSRAGGAPPANHGTRNTEDRV